MCILMLLDADDTYSKFYRAAWHYVYKLCKFLKYSKTERDELRHSQADISSNRASFFQFVASPICCPNRASILTGRYQHNHLTVNNTIAGGCSSTQWQQSREPTTFGALMQELAKYKTFYAGKYLNEVGAIFHTGA